MRMPGTILVAVLLALSPVTPGFAQATIWSSVETNRLDALFARLRVAPDEATARILADDIWTIWTRPSNEIIALRVKEIIEGGGFAGPTSQIPLIDALVADYPDYSGGWDLRATARFHRGDNAGSLADIAETLAREPRHFGPLAGRALILDSQGRREEALAAIRAALPSTPSCPSVISSPSLPVRNRSAPHRRFRQGNRKALPSLPSRSVRHRRRLRFHRAGTE
jgi:hypothetical protein